SPRDLVAHQLAFLGELVYALRREFEDGGDGLAVEAGHGIGRAVREVGNRRRGQLQHSAIAGPRLKAASLDHAPHAGRRVAERGGEVGYSVPAVRQFWRPSPLPSSRSLP